MKKFAFVLSGIVFGIAAAIVISSYAGDQSCFPIGGGGCVKVAVPAGTDPPANCHQGEIYIDLDTTPDVNCTTGHNYGLCLCVAENTWAEVGH